MYPDFNIRLQIYRVPTYIIVLTKTIITELSVNDLPYILHIQLL